MAFKFIRRWLLNLLREVAFKFIRRWLFSTGGSVPISLCILKACLSECWPDKNSIKAKCIILLYHLVNSFLSSHGG